MTDPQRLPPLARRQAPKRLGKLPVALAAGGGVLLVVVPIGAALYSIVQRQNAASVQPSDAAPGSPGDAFAGAEGYTPAPGSAPIIEVAARAPMTVPREDRKAAATGTEQRREPDVHAQARLQAWQAYYEAARQMKADRRQGAIDAMRADTAGPQSQARQGGQQAQDGGQSSPGAGGQPGGRGGFQPAPRPGEMYQGPADAAGIYLATAPVAAVSPWELKRGASVIPFTLDQDISTGTAGQFTATVHRHVFAYSGSGDILIPQGARLIGIYEDQTSAGDERMKVAITSITFPPTGNPRCPGGEEMPIGSMPGADASGKAGFEDRVNRHYGRVAFNAFINLIGGAASQASGAFGGQGVAALLAAQGGQAGQMALNQLSPRQSGIGPTFETRAGFKGVLQLTKSIPFTAPWRPGIGFCGADASGEDALSPEVTVR